MERKKEEIPVTLKYANGWDLVWISGPGFFGGRAYAVVLDSYQGHSISAPLWTRTKNKRRQKYKAKGQKNRQKINMLANTQKQL